MSTTERVSPAQILLIAEDRAIAADIARKLKDVGVEVTEVGTGRRGVELARSKSFDLIILDLMQPTIDVEELVASICAQLRQPPIAPLRRFALDDVVVDLDAHTATVLGAPISLTSAEFCILAFLIQRSGRVISREQLAKAAMSSDGDRGERTIDSHVARIRRKLGPAAAARIVTVWGIGYRFDAQ